MAHRCLLYVSTLFVCVNNMTSRYSRVLPRPCDYSPRRPRLASATHATHLPGGTSRESAGALWEFGPGVFVLYPGSEMRGAGFIVARADGTPSHRAPDIKALLKTDLINKKEKRKTLACLFVIGVPDCRGITRITGREPPQPSVPHLPTPKPPCH